MACSSHCRDAVLGADFIFSARQRGGLDGNADDFPYK